MTEEQLKAIGYEQKRDELFKWMEENGLTETEASRVIYLLGRDLERSQKGRKIAI